MRRRLSSQAAGFVALATSLGVALGACASGGGSGSGSPAAAGPTSVATSTSTATVTVSTTTVPGPGSSSSSAGVPSSTSSPSRASASTHGATSGSTTSSSATSSSATASPASVVEAYYAAINAQDYQSAWNLGGSHLNADYGTFAAGFADTAHDTLTVTGTDGAVVSVRLDALQTDGSTQHYAGTYTVRGGEIVAADLVSTGSSGPTTSAPTASGATTSGPTSSDAPRRGEYCKDAELGTTTTDASGATLTCEMESGRAHWH